MRHSKNYSLRLPERVTERNDPADIDDLTFDMESIDSVLKVQDNEDKRLERDKLDKADHNRHKTAVPIDHPDGSVTDAKLGNRTVLTTTGTLQTLLTAIGNAIKAIVGAATWNSVPPITLTDAKAHTVNAANPHKVTKAQVGLGSADNTSDVNKPVSTAQQTALNGKVDKITGKGLSTEDYTSDEKEAVAANSAARHTHGNKSVLDGITAALVSNWNAAFTHIADAVKHITAAERTRWNAVTTKLGLTGGTLTGFLTLHANPTANLHAATKQYVDNSVSDLGGGDMLKAVYDTTNNGIVDKAESVAWGGVTGKPTSFTPAVHKHAIADVTGLSAQLANFSSIFAAIVHKHATADVTGLDAALSYKSNVEAEKFFWESGDLNTVTGVNKWYSIGAAKGILNLPQTRYTIDMLNNSAVHVFGQNNNSFIQMLFAPQLDVVYTRRYCQWLTPQWTDWKPLATTADIYYATVGTGWTNNGDHFAQWVSIPGIRASDNPIIDLKVLGLPMSTITPILENWGYVFGANCDNGGINIYAHGTAPTVNIPIQLKVVR